MHRVKIFRNLCAIWTFRWTLYFRATKPTNWVQETIQRCCWDPGPDLLAGLVCSTAPNSVKTCGTAPDSVNSSAHSTFHSSVDGKFSVHCAVQLSVQYSSVCSSVQCTVQFSVHYSSVCHTVQCAVQFSVQYSSVYTTVQCALQLRDQYHL